MKILGTGLTGLLGARITEILSDFEFTSISRTNGIDITDVESLKPHVSQFSGEYVLHMAAKADVDGCEQDKDLGERGEAWKINVGGTRNMAQLCKEYGKKLIYISTDFVFDGEKPEKEGYIEEDVPNPINWYGATKYYGEEEVRKSGAEHVILRIAYPYGISSAPKEDFVRIISKRLREKKPVIGVTDHIFVPTYIDDIAGAIRAVMEKKLVGLYHAVGSTSLTPYDAAVLIAQKTGVDASVIGKTTRAEYFKEKANRPFNLYLKNDRIKSLGVEMRGFTEGLDEVIKHL